MLKFKKIRQFETQCQYARKKGAKDKRYGAGGVWGKNKEVETGENIEGVGRNRGEGTDLGSLLTSFSFSCKTTT